MKRLMNVDEAKVVCQDHSTWQDHCLPLWEKGVILCMYITMLFCNVRLYFIGQRHAVRPRPKTGVMPARRPVARADLKRPHLKEKPLRPARPAPRAAPDPAPCDPAPAPEATPPPPPPGPGGLYELDPITAQALEDELHQIMIEVWQTLPDNPPCPVEKMVVDKYRNEAGDLLRDVLGLNVTKRLLNTFNRLNVKVHFSTKPERKYLRNFLKQYNFVAFRRAAGLANTFAAQVRSVTDYDRLCARADVRCGAARITITPCYRFKQCPKNLRTIYATPEEDKTEDTNKVIEKVKKEYDEVMDSTNEEKIENIVQDTNTKATTADEENAIKQDNTAAINENKNNPANSQPKITPKLEQENNTASAKPQAKITPSSKADNKVETPAADGPVKAKVAETEVAKPQPKVVDTKPAPAKPQPKVVDTKPAPANPQPKVVDTKPAPAKPQPKVVDTKPAPSNPQPKVVDTKPLPAKPQPKVVNTKPAPANPQSKVVDTKPAPANPQPKVVDTEQIPTKPQPKVVNTKPATANPQPKVVDTKPTPANPHPKAVDTEQIPTKPQPKVVNTKPATAKPQPKVVDTKVAAAKPQLKVVDTKKATAKLQRKVVNTKPTPAKPKGTPIKTIAKNAKTKNVAAVKKNTAINSSKKAVNKTAEKKHRKSFEEKDDFEELDDEDILALMSGGIVLDECSGSDAD